MKQQLSSEDRRIASGFGDGGLGPLWQPQQGPLRAPQDVLAEQAAWEQVGTFAHDGHASCRGCEWRRVERPTSDSEGCTECTLGDRGWHKVEWCPAYAELLEQAQ